MATGLKDAQFVETHCGKRLRWKRNLETDSIPTYGVEDWPQFLSRGGKTLCLHTSKRSSAQHDRFLVFVVACTRRQLEGYTGHSSIIQKRRLSRLPGGLARLSAVTGFCHTDLVVSTHCSREQTQALSYDVRKENLFFSVYVSGGRQCFRLPTWSRWIQLIDGQRCSKT
ncbi:hypothetical protein BC567DRAFT_5404 [Phyllosticta citribraziliensis]